MNPHKEPDSDPKDITGKDIEKNPLKGLETDMDRQGSDEAEDATFETYSALKG